MMLMGTGNGIISVMDPLHCSPRVSEAILVVLDRIWHFLILNFIDVIYARIQVLRMEILVFWS